MDRVINYKPLVSCTVLSYNSAKTIVETLNSIAGQTYGKIELIISDDCSKDNTVEICRQWIEQNNPRFVRIELLTVPRNTGVCANANRSLAACQGEWTKGIAADDILLPNCIKDFVEFVQGHPEAKWVSSYMQTYNDEFNPSNLISEKSVSRRPFFELSVKEQLKQMTLWNLIAAPSLFYNVKMLRSVGGFDSEYSFEDYPTFLTLLENGYKCYFMDKVTVGYRVHESISNSHGKLFNYKFSRESKRFHEGRCFKYLTWWQKRGQYAIYGLQYCFEKMGLNRNTPKIKKVYHNLSSFLKVVFNN